MYYENLQHNPKAKDAQQSAAGWELAQVLCPQLILLVVGDPQ